MGQPAAAPIVNSTRKPKLHRKNTPSKQEVGAARERLVKQQAAAKGGPPEPQHGRPPGWFSSFAMTTARLSGKPATFLIACVLIIAWAVTGPLFNYSDTWQLVVNTSTTIVTFLMVFLIQNTQNRDSLAFQIKLAELIIAMRGAENRLATVEDMCDADLESLHEKYRNAADETLETLKKRRGALEK